MTAASCNMIEWGWLTPSTCKWLSWKCCIIVCVCVEWHVIPEPLATLQGAATWWIHCHNSRAKCHIAGCSHLTKSMSWSCHVAECNNSIRHIENRFSPYFILFLFFFLTQFGLWRAAAFVSSPIHLLNSQIYRHFNSAYIRFLDCFRKNSKPDLCPINHVV